MARANVCSECPPDSPTRILSNPQAKTCGKSCRDKRSRRLARNRKRVGEANALPDHLKAVQEVVARSAPDDMHEVLKEELRPIVREAITEDVLRAASQLVNLTPVMVQAITEDLNSSDKILRQRAYTLLAKYTLGNQSIAPASQEHTPQPMQVVFALPRPDTQLSPAEVDLPPEEPTAVVVRQCVECSVDKPDSEFMGASDRCVECHEKVQARVRARFGES